jgi:uncharacterized protein YecE (DUF72 family)
VAHLLRLWLGTSGYDYSDWKGRFYPVGLPSSQKLFFYLQSFNSVEINSTFYHFPKPSTIERLRGLAPKGFRFSIKAWKVITHFRRLAKCKRKVNDFLKRVSGLKQSLGPVLFQLPPNFHCDLDRLKRFLKFLSKEFRYVMEFRHDSWLKHEVHALLREYKVAVCRVSSPQLNGPIGVFTGDFGYWRLHGARDWYRGEYSPEELRDFGNEIRFGIRNGKAAYVYFDNTTNAQAVKDASRLKSIVNLANH